MTRMESSLLRYHGGMRRWFENHPMAVLLLIALAVITSSYAARLVQETSSGELAPPALTLVGVLNTAVHFGVIAVAIGLVVGMTFVAHRRFKFVQDACRVAVPMLIPLTIGIAAGYSGRSTHYSGSPAAQSISIGIYALAAVLVLGFLFVSGLTRRRTPRTDVAIEGEPVERFRTGRHLAATALTLVIVSACVLSGIWLGRQLDVHRRIWMLNRVGRVYQGVADNMVGGVYGVFLGERANDDHLRLLRGLPHISEINVHAAAITDEGCRHLAVMRYLRLLDLTNVPIHDDGLRHISGHRALRWVILRQTKVTRESFQILATVPQLANIVIEDLMPGGPSLGETRLPATLQEVHLTRCGLTDDDLASIATLNLVRRLTLRDNHIRGPGLVHVARNTGLGTVYLGGNPIDDRYLACFSTMSLNGLDLNGIRLTEAGVDAIASQSMLEYLAVRASGITDSQLQRIVVSTKLRDAELDATNLSPEALKGWRPRDVGLYLEDAKVEASDIERLARFGLDVYLIRCELSMDADAELDDHPQLFDMTDCRIGGRVVSGVYPNVESTR